MSRQTFAFFIDFTLFPFLENVHSHRTTTTGRENLINFYRHEFYIFKIFCMCKLLPHPYRREIRHQHN